MAIIHDFSKIKEQLDKAAEDEFKFGEEIMRVNCSPWKAMAVLEVPEENILVMFKYGFQEGRRYGCFLLDRPDAMMKTGRILTTKERFLDWLESELENDHPEED